MPNITAKFVVSDTFASREGHLRLTVLHQISTMFSNLICIFIDYFLLITQQFSGRQGDPSCMSPPHNY